MVSSFAGAPPGQSGGGWTTAPAQTIQAGTGAVYQLNPWQALSPGICFGHDEYDFDAYMTYRVDVLGGQTEYANVVIWGPWNQNYCLNGGHWADPGFAVYFTTAPPPAGYDPWNNGGASPGTEISQSQLTYAHNVPSTYDQSLYAVGNWTIDASANYSSAAMSNVLNSLCANAPNTTCSFTQTGPLAWGIGLPGTPQQASNCAAPGSAPSSLSITYTADQSATLSIGAGVTLSDEVNLFNVIASDVSVSVEGQHQWGDTQTFIRTTSVAVPPRDIASVWTVPVQAKVTGTLVVSNSSAQFTITNFSEQRDGVSTSTLAGVDPPNDNLSPSFDVLTKVRPMTPAELQSSCHLGAVRGLGIPPTPTARLVPQQGVARVKLGQSQAQVVGALGQPQVKRFPLTPCRNLGAGCYATRGIGGIWAYPQLSVVFGPDLRVTGLIYTGAQRTAGQLGVGSTLAAVRRALPSAVCAHRGTGTDCTLTRRQGQWTIKTVFRSTKTNGAPLKCMQVLIYVIRNSGKAGS